MEMEFRCSRNALQTARIRFWFYAAGIPIIVVLFLLPFFLYKQNRIEWHVIIYVLLSVFFIYQGYRAFCVLRSLRRSCCRIDGESVSGISTIKPHQKGMPFLISVKEIIKLDETIIAAERKEDIGYHPRTLHRPPFESQKLNGYRSTVIITENASYVLFGIAMTDEIKEALKPAYK